jgi:hypothetical protein
MLIVTKVLDDMTTQVRGGLGIVCDEDEHGRSKLTACVEMVVRVVRVVKDKLGR